MRYVKYLLIVVAVLALGLFVARRVFAVQIGEAAFRTAAKANLGRNPVAGQPDGLALILVGTGSPLPDPTRAGPMTVVSAGGKLFAVDAGGGSARSLTRSSYAICVYSRTIVSSGRARGRR